MTRETAALYFFFYRFFFRLFTLFVITPDCKKIIPLAVSVWPFETLRSININQSALHTDSLRPGFILMVVFTFQVVVLKRDNDGST